MLKLGEISSVSIRGMVGDREVRLDRNNRVTHWRSVEVASHCSASRECMLIIYLKKMCTVKIG